MKRTRDPRANKVKDFRKRGQNRGFQFFHRTCRVQARRASAALVRAEVAAYLASKEA